MSQYSFSIIESMRTYSIHARARNYPAFEGKYNLYVSVYGQLSGAYLGDIEEPLKMDCKEEEIGEVLNNTDLNTFVKNQRFSIW